MTEDLIDLIANDGRRNAAGGIYSTRVYEFANAIEAEATAPLLARIAELEAQIAASEKHRNDLADKIVSQQTEIGALKSQIATVAPAVDAQPAWIGVDERLPEIDYSNPAYARGVKVLAAWGNDPGNVAEMEYRSNAYAKTEKGRLPRFEWQGRVSPWTVTHWMPLPEAPAALSQHKAGDKS